MNPVYKEIPVFNWQDLHKKTLEIHVNDTDEAMVVMGLDRTTGILYMLHSEVNPNE